MKNLFNNIYLKKLKYGTLFKKKTQHKKRIVLFCFVTNEEKQKCPSVKNEKQKYRVRSKAETILCLHGPHKKI